MSARRHARVTVGIPTYNRAALLRETMESVLAQTYPDFRLLISDNASADGTQDMVLSFDDPRIDYAPLDGNIGMIANFNRLIELANTEFLVLLPDDDLLYPDYLGSVLEVLNRFPSVGAVHTAYDVIGAESRILSPATNLVGRTQRLTIESTGHFLRRALSSQPVVCFASAIYRTRAIRGAGGLREEEEPFSDIPLWMRIALDWEFGFVSNPLVAFRLHGETATAQLGTFNGSDYELPVHRILRDRRRGFLAEAAGRLPPNEVALYRRISDRTFRVDEVRRLANDAGRGLTWWSASQSLLALTREDPRVLALPRAWRLLAAQLGGRIARRSVSRLTGAVPRRLLGKTDAETAR